MPRTEPLITPEELQCLLGGAPVRSSQTRRSPLAQRPPLHFGAAIWLVKGVFLYAVLMSPEAAQWMGSSRYLWMRGSLELVGLTAFWGASLHPRGHTVAFASLLVASTTLLLDVMTLLALAS
jgi:Zn-dependent protease